MLYSVEAEAPKSMKHPMDSEKVKGVTKYVLKNIDILDHFICPLTILDNTLTILPDNNQEVIRRMENGITKRCQINVSRIYYLTLRYVKCIMRNAGLETEMGVKIVRIKFEQSQIC